MKNLFNKLVLMFGLALVGLTSAYAAIPAGVQTALDTAETDGVAIAGIVLGVIVAIAAFKYIRRAL